MPGPAARSIESVSLTLEPGGICGVLGPNGSGKSTLLKLMQGLYRPARGRVLLDGADIAQFTRAELADWIGYVPQECVLFAGSIRDNIAQRRPGASDEEVTRGHARRRSTAWWSTCRTATPPTSARPVAGYRPGSASASPSPAPWSAIRRAPARRADRAASITRRKRAMRDMLVEWARTRTVVVVTHSQSLLTACRTLVRLQRGRILLEGPREEVMPQLVPRAQPSVTVGRGRPCRRPDRPRERGSQMNRLDALVLHHPLPTWRTAAWPIMAMLALLLTWSAFAKLEQVAVATGEVVPQGKVKVVQHLEGGIIENIYVTEGSSVHAGDPLVRLDLATSGVNRKELVARLDGAILRRARLAAETTGAPLALPRRSRRRQPSVAEAERQAFAARRRELESSLTVLQEQARQRELEVQELEAKRKAAGNNLALARERLKMSASLLEEGLTARMEHLRLQSEVESLQGEMEGLAPAIPRARAAVAEAAQRLREAEIKFRRDAQDELGEAEQTIARVQELLAEATDQGRARRDQEPDRRRRQEAPLQHHRRRGDAGRADHGNRSHRRPAGGRGQAQPDRPRLRPRRPAGPW